MATSNVTSKITRPDGTALSGVAVYAYLNPRPSFRTSDGTELPGAARTTTAADGTYTLTLERTADITPANTFYTVLEDIPSTDGGQRTYTIQVAAINQTLLASLIAVPTVPSLSVFLTQAAADARYVQSPGSFAAVGNITDSRPADAASAGVLTTYARGDHKHSRETIAGTAAQRAALSGINLYAGLKFYETDTDKLWYYSGATWRWFAPGMIQVIQADSTLTTIAGTETTAATLNVAAQSSRYNLLVTGAIRISAGVAVGDQYMLRVKDGATVIAKAYVNIAAAAQEQMQTPLGYVQVAGGGAKTITLTLKRESGTGSVSTTVDGEVPTGLVGWVVPY